MGKSIDIKSLPQSYFRASESVLGNAGEPASPRLGLLGSGSLASGAMLLSAARTFSFPVVR